MLITPIKTPIIKKSDQIADLLIKYLPKNLPDRNLIVISSKVIALTQGRIASKKDFSKILKKEADLIISAKKYALTIKNNIFIANAGIDESNSQKGQIILWPEKIQPTLDHLRKKLQAYYKVKNLGLLAVDSCCTPLRRGVNAVCLGYCGFIGIQDERGKKDLFRRPLKVTQRNLADMLAAAAVAVMGESNESTPFAIIKDAPVNFTNKKVNSPKELSLPPKECLFSWLYRNLPMSQKENRPNRLIS